MDHQLYLSGASNSLVAFILIVSISVATLALLPRGNKRSQLLWIVPCLALSFFEAVTDNAVLSPLGETVAAFIATLITSIMLSEHAQAENGQRVSRPVSLLVCGVLSAFSQTAPFFGLAGGGETALTLGSLIAACCWPLLVRDVRSRASSHYDREYLSALLLAYALIVMLPAIEGLQPGSGLEQAEAAIPFLGVMIGFVASAFALRRAFREKERLIAAEQAARSALEDTTMLLRGLIEMTPAAVFVKGLDGRYRLINKLAAEWCDRTKPEVLGRTDFDLFPPDLAQAMREHDDLVITTGRQHSKDFQLRPGQDGVRRALTTCKFPLFGADGKVALVAGLAMDMTAIKQHARDLENARFKAEEASCAKSNFLAHMSHELRTPLNAIIGFSEIIHSGALGPVGNDLYQQYAADIHAAGQLLLAHVNDLLDMSQFDSDSVELSPQSLNLALMVADCCHLLRAQAERRRIKLEIERTRGLPPVYGDLRATVQVLMNLIGSAIKHLPAGSTITIAGGRTENGAPYLLIEDDGPDRSAGDLQALVDPWTFRPAGKADEGRGGLGLLLARKLMEAQGGRLIVERSPASGTRIACQFANRAEDLPATRSVGA